ncbi:MAG: sulfite exporter TauE/SafE family protein [Rubrivivax sp.]|nr:sulfite exporter TauE/SafE family protein [Rubrivivax sp.]
MTEALAGWPAGITPLGYAALGALVLVGACLQGIGGIGFAMFAAPVAVLLAPVMVPGPLLLLGGIVSALAALREPAAIDWTLARRCIGGRVVGAALAAAVMLVLPPRPLAAAFGVLLLAGVALSLLGWRIEPTRANAWGAGTLSGLMGTITSVGAPPLGLLTQRLPAPTIRATIGGIIALGAAASLVMLAWAGLFGGTQLVLGLSLFPWVWAGFRVSSRLVKRIPAAHTRRLLLALVAGSALLVLGKAALG